MSIKKIISLLLAGIIAITSLFALSGCGKESEPESESFSEVEETTEAPKELTISISKAEALAMGYQKLCDTLKQAGFTNADYNGLGDLTSSTDKNNDKIASITIDGKDTFEKGVKVMSNAKIIINYHSVKQANIPFDIAMKRHDEGGLSEFNYEDVKTQFEQEGFTNISTRTVEDDSKEENTVKEISVNGKNLNDSYESLFPIDAKVVITYYTKKAKVSEADSKAESKVESSDSDNKSGDSGSVTPSFKETMDSYEKFFDDYIAFMKKYMDNPSDVTLIADYTKFMTQYTDTMNKLDSIDTDSLSEADYLYYTEVMARISKKLAEVGQ